jgi:hypothetical protein
VTIISQRIVVEELTPKKVPGNNSSTVRGKIGRSLVLYMRNFLVCVCFTKLEGAKRVP